MIRPAPKVCAAARDFLVVAIYMSMYEVLASIFARDPVEAAQKDVRVPINSQLKPWKNNPRYFRKVYILPLATIKMAVHANAGGSIEVMGMMTGSIVQNGIVVNDVYPLPVEGTETRVNAQAEGYEYMVQYLEGLKQVGRNEHIVGWYHSHPGYGCWLSGIDVATQSLNQNFQDPYLAVVVDPVKTAAQGKVEIGAFRTLPDDYKHDGEDKELGVHSDKYYPLEVEVTPGEADVHIIENIMNESWMSFLAHSSSQLANDLEKLQQRVKAIVSQFRKQDHVRPRAPKISELFDSHFEAMIHERLQNSRCRQKDVSDGSSSDMEEDSGDDTSSRRSDNSDAASEQMDESRQRKRAFGEERSLQKRLLSRVQRIPTTGAYFSTVVEMDSLERMAEAVGSSQLQYMATMEVQERIFGGGSS